MDHDRRWFALCVKPKHEKSTAQFLARRGFEQFSPLYAARHRWSDREKTVHLPLFPGYVFCRFDRQDRTSVLATPGVVSLVKFGAEPAAVEESEIDSVRAAVNSRRTLHPWPYLAAGTRVRVSRGVLAGVSGTLLREQGRFRVVLNVSLIQCSVAVEVDRVDIAPEAGEQTNSCKN